MAAVGLRPTRTQPRPATPTSAPAPEDAAKVELKAFCFEKWRLIEASRRMGDSEYFSYVGLASPRVRKQLVLFPNQTNIDRIIEKELRKLGVFSKTNALADLFGNEQIRRVTDYYVAASKSVLDKDRQISGMVVAGKDGILCADVYASPRLFEKMLSQLLQSAAIGICTTRAAVRKDLARNDVEEFVDNLRQIRKFKKESVQTYRLFYPKTVAAAEVVPGEDGPKVVHVEAYPR